MWVRLVEEGDKVGFPLLVKAVLGGGGKGMKLATSAKELPVSTLVFPKSATKVDMHSAPKKRKTERRFGIPKRPSTEHPSAATVDMYTQKATQARQKVDRYFHVPDKCLGSS